MTVKVTHSSGRLISLDAFRGFTIAAMFVVLNHGINNENVIPSQLLHAKWHGWTITDFILPFFIFIVGVAMPFSFHKRLSLGQSFQSQIWHALKRALLILLFGVIIRINSVGYFMFDLWGALQVIAVCYFFAFLTLPLRIRTQAIITGVVLIVYYLLFALITPPTGAANPYVFNNNIGSEFDLWLLGMTHFSNGGYVTINIFPAIPNCIMGIMVGKLLRSQTVANKKLIIILSAGIIGVILGLLIDPIMPINKRLWTSSFALFAGGWACLFFILFYWLIDIQGYKKWVFPFVIYGMNPITIYTFNGLWKPWILNRWSFGTSAGLITLKKAVVTSFVSWFGALAGSLTYTAVIVLIYWLICYWMYRKKIFLKL